MPENEIIPMREGPETAPVETAKEKFEREQLTRRPALKRFGMTSAMTAFALFSVDDLAHIVGKAMQQRAGDNKVAGQVANEFQQAGVAFAGGPSWLNCGPCKDNCQAAPGSYQHCDACAWPCTGGVLRNDFCYTGLIGYTACQACCKAQNPPNTTPGHTGYPNYGYNNCVSASGCQ